ncbi:MAG: 3-hydroxyacyl-CoA dehydrogenase family protein [Clostridiales bacterium]|nr:3-hydroxyacyl-CoA dehydrogenase family protein [Clostridiales bacterium]
MSKLSKFVVCGSGMMGAAIAQILASIDGAQVTILRSSNRGADPREKVRSNMKQLVEKGVVTPAYVDELVAKIDIAFDDEAVKDGELFIECVPEVMELKQDLFARLEKTVSEKAIFCTNTSVMSPTEISEKCEHKERICGTHFWNPAFLIPLVEVVKTEYTTDEVINTVMEVMTAAGKQPCLCKKDVPGFIANRMQHALWREAVAIVNDGIADAATVDLACKTSFGLRLPYLPPLVNSDMVGTQLTYNIHSYVLEHLADNHEPSPILKDMIDKGELGFRAEPDENGVYHGFMDYTKDQISEINNGLNEYLIKMLYDK